MTVMELRKVAKEYKIKLTKNGKYKTMKELKNEIDNMNNTVNGEGITQKTRNITRKISKNINKYAPILEIVAPEIAPELIATNQLIKLINGGSLSAKDTKDFLKSSYSKELKDINNYKIDKSLSGQRVQVYHNTTNNKTVVVHRGTASIQDWGTNLSMTLGHKGKRFNHAKKIQKQAEEKYGKNNLITLGHSQGAKWAEMLGNKKNGNEVITLNKPTLPLDLIQGKKVKKNQTDIKTSSDPVSFLRGLQKGKKAKVMKSKTINPLKEHSVDVLNRLDDNEMLGVPDINGGSVKSNYVKNLIYKDGFNPSKVKNPSKSIKNMNKQNTMQYLNTIQFLKTLQSTVVKDKTKFKTLTTKKNKNNLMKNIIDNLILYDKKFEELKKYYNINNNTLLKKDVNELNKFLTNITNKDFVDNAI